MVTTAVLFTCLLAILAILTSTAESQCTHGDVQLVGGSGSYQGNVQICNDGVWGWVCDNSWSSNDAQVVCRQLGFSTTNVYYKSSSFYGYGNGTIWLDYMYCNGAENKLIDCAHAYDIGVTTCGYNEMAGVYCQSGGSCTNGDIRLANGYAGRSEGQVEVCQNQEWGKVCINGWDTDDATVACKQLGYDDSYNSFGGGSGMNDLGCNGTETSLFDCSGITLDIHSCSYSHTLRARCYSRDDSYCTDGDIRLWSAYDNTPENEGMLQTCNNGTWNGICDYSSCYVAKLACTQLGYAGVVGQRYNAGRYYGYYYYQDVYRYYCSSYHTSLSQCYKYNYYYCSAYYDSLGVICYESTEVEPLPSVCNDGDIQLVNGTNGTNDTDDEGRVEYCYNGTWVPVCSLSAKTASFMCQQLGHSQFTFATIYSDERFGRSNIKSSFNYIYCSNYYTNFSQCSVRNKGGSCYISIAACSTEYSLRCYSPENECNDGDVRLVDGAIEQEGRPEVCFNGIWGSICRYSWNTIDSYVFCKTLGYDGPSPITYTYYSPFGSGDGPIVWNYVYCQGWEQDINDCSKTLYPSFTCYSTYTIGVTCKESCVDNDVRLVGGDFNNEGTVEVCFDNLWGLISQEGWTERDAKVICNQIGYKRGIAQPKYGSFYGKPKKTIHLRNVNCVGDENSFSECTKTRLSLYSGKLEQTNTEVAGVDCIYDEPTEPPCIENPDIKPSDDCNSPGSFRLMKKGSVSTNEGRVEYCYNEFWTPLCTMDNRLADVACRQLGHTQYSWGAIVESGEFGTLLNYSLIVNITCSGSESSVSDCTPFATDDNCLPWCPHNNVGLRCFDTGDCEEGTIRLVDGIIEQEGRVEVCIDSVWGSVCDEGWDKTDAHVVCRQMGHPELEPIVFLNSYFGNGQFPIIYSNMKCGGWESNIHDCQKETFLELKCPSRNVAGVLCGYDCEDGDVRLVGGTTKNEGTVEVCFDNLWGLIEEAGWSDKDAEIVCKQLGYEVEGSTAYGGSQYGKPNKTIHLTMVQCTGDEERINECTQTSYSLEEGKNKLKTVEVAGIKCYVSNDCVSPPIGGTACVNGEIRLTGTNLKNGEGVLEYCYKGLWSTFCSLGEREAIVACRQLGYIGYDLVSIFNDGRFDSHASNISYFENVTCSQSYTEFSLSECDIVDSCQSSCKNAVGIRCFEFANCEEGDVRLMDGDNSKGGRIEVCANNIWGSICSDGFDKTDAYVVCKELDLGESEPTVYINSYFGDGDLPIVYSNMECRGYENTILECTKQEFGTFTCSRDKVVGITCQDGCENGIVRLVGGEEDTEGTVEICYYNIWGLVAVHGWDDNDATVVCNELGFTSDGAVSFTDSRYGKPNKTVHLSNVDCSGLEDSLKECDASHIPPDEGSDLFQFVDVVGVSCSSSSSISTYESTTSDQTKPSVTPAASKRTDEGSMTIGLIIIVILFVITVVVVACLTIYIMFKRKSTKQKIQNLVDAQRITMSSIDDREDHGVINPETLDIETLDEKCILAD